MNITPEQLQKEGYTLLHDLDHQQVIPFVRKWLKGRTTASLFFNGSNLILFGLLCFCIYDNKYVQDFSFAYVFSRFSIGCALAFALVPLHEYIHAIAYRSQGAKHTSYDANLKRFYFMAMADRFVANRKEFRVVALAPFIIINAALLLALMLVQAEWTIVISTVLLVHTACCSGDFGLLSYFDHHKDMEVVTYDDKANKISYFYGKPL